MKRIDLNSDVGEGIGNEDLLMPYLSSCNISCGLHAGDDDTIRKVIGLAKKYGVAIGAHPSYDDRANFGRVEMQLELNELKTLIRDQVKKMKRLCQEQGANLMHVKPHGALYNQAAKSKEISNTIISAILEVDRTLKLFGLANSETQNAAIASIAFVPEGFIDRRYLSKKELMPRSVGGLITEQQEIKDQMKSILERSEVKTPNGQEKLKVATLCMHGDTPGAEQNIKVNYLIAKSLGFQILPPQ